MFDLSQHIPNADSGGRVESCGRLVEKEDVGFVHESARDFKPPPHAAGKVLNRFIRPLRELYGFKQFFHHPPAPFARNAVKLREDVHVLDRRQLHVGSQRLRDHANRTAHVGGGVHHVKIVDPRASGSGKNQCGEHADERRLPRAVGAEQAEDFAPFDVEAQAVNGAKRPKALFDFLDFNRGHGLSSLQDLKFEISYLKSRIHLASASGTSTYAVKPGQRHRSLLSTRKRNSKVLTSRLVRFTSLCVA